MSSKLEIAQTALSNIYARAISTFDERSTEAVICKRYIDKAIRAVLKANAWSFAIKDEPLAYIGESSGLYKYAYVHPKDSVRRIMVHTPKTTTTAIAECPHRRIGDQIVTDCENAYLMYVSADTVEKFDDDFAMVCSLKLSLYIAPKVGKGNSQIDVNNIEAKYEKALMQAIEADAAGQSDIKRVFPIIAARIS